GQSSSLHSSKERPMLKNIVRGVAVGFLTLSLGVYAEAKPKNGGNSFPKGPNFQLPNKPINNGKPIINGNTPVINNVSPKFFCKPVKPIFCYKACDCLWNQCCWCNWLGCEIYWCPVTCQWFYFCEPCGCYYLVIECPCY